MDLFDLLASTPPQGKKRKIGEHGESPQLTPDVKKCEGAHSADVKHDVFEEEHLKKSGRRTGMPYQRASETLSVEQRLKKWGLDKEFTVHGGSRLGCITCMKYGAWCEQEGADTKKKKKKKEMKKKKKKEKKEHPEEVKSPRKSHGPAEADSGDEERTRADIQQAFQKGTYEPPVGTQAIPNRLKYSLKRHLSGSQHKAAASAREDEEHVKDHDVPSDAQMMFVYDEVKKSPMVPPSMILEFVSDTQSHHDLNSPGDRYMLQNMKQNGIT
jgi:hypothetical protein